MVSFSCIYLYTCLRKISIKCMCVRVQCSYCVLMYIITFAQMHTPRMIDDDKMLRLIYVLFLLFSVHILYCGFDYSRYIRVKWKTNILSFFLYTKQITTCPPNCWGDILPKIYIPYYRYTCNRSLYYIHHVI